MKMLITLEPRGIFGSNFVYLCILPYPAAGGQNGAETSPSIILDCRSLLVKMLITFEAHGIFSSNFACLYSLHCRDTGMQNKDKASPSISLAGHV